MYKIFAGSHHRTEDYDRLVDDEIAEKSFQEELDRRTESLKWSRYWFCGLSAILIVVAGVTGYFFGALRSNDCGVTNSSSDVAARVPISTSRKTFQYNSSFAIPPPGDGGKEPIWDSMIPNGLGYIKNTDMVSETSVLSAFHQLHCLYTVRRAYYSNRKDGELEDFDLGKERKPHVAHCFDYIRQGILCSADSTIEPAVDTVNGFLGAGFPRICRNFEELKGWAEDHRAFDAQGFLVEKEAHGREDADNI